MNNNRDFKASLKSLDTEENIDIYFYRHLGWFWAGIARKLNITPNAITIASIFIGIGAGLCFYFTDIWVNIGGLLLLALANSFDSADGQLARMTGQYSRLGRILDGMAGDFWFLTIYICICLRSIQTVDVFHADPWSIWTLAAIAAVSHVIQAALADYYRQMHLYCINGKSELETSSHLEQTMAGTTHKFGKLVMALYVVYTRCQERFTPNAGLLMQRLCQQYPDGQIPASLRRAFRRGSLPLMKYANALTFNWRSICLAVTLIAGAPWIYLVVEVIGFNALLIYMRQRHEKLCRRLLGC